MKKRVSKRKLNAKASHSRSMLKNLLESLLTYGKIETTVARAKALKSYADEQIGYAVSLNVKKDFNPMIKKTGNEKTAILLRDFAEYIKKQNKKNNTGYTSLVRTRYRKGDDAMMAEITILGFEDFIKSSKRVVKKTPKKVTKKSVKPETKKAVSKTRKKVESGGQKQESAPALPDNQEKKSNVFTQLGDRFMGRKNQGPKTGSQQRARSRSGI
jgi:large subunit ribosomal protein L17